MKTFKEITANKLVAKKEWSDADSSEWQYATYFLQLDKDGEWTLSLSVYPFGDATAAELKSSFEFEISSDTEMALDAGSFDQCLETLKKLGFKSWNEMNLGAILDMAVMDTLDLISEWKGDR